MAETPGASYSVAQKTRERMALEHRQTMTVEEYFLLERNDSDTRYEYVDGYIYAMADVPLTTIRLNQMSREFSGGYFAVGNVASTAQI